LTFISMSCRPNTLSGHGGNPSGQHSGELPWGTEGSNPASSTSESVANLTPPSALVAGRAEMGGVVRRGDRHGGPSGASTAT
jgi:hypothetical protein